jgi:hypothetical protein
MKYALQMYSVRDGIKTGDDLLAALAKVKAIGYDGVEFAGTFGLPAETLKAKLDEAGIDGVYLRKLVAAKGKFNEDVPIEQFPEGFVTEWVLKNWEQIVQAIISDPKFLPF